jgi:hypothetical protein
MLTPGILPMRLHGVRLTMVRMMVAVALASEGGEAGTISIEHLRPWLRYGFVAEDYPFGADS